MSTQRNTFWSVVIGAALVFSLTSNPAWGQCSSGRTSAGLRGLPSASGSLATTPTFNLRGNGPSSLYAPQLPLQMFQQQIAVARQLAYRQQIERYQERQSLLSQRQERADRTRQMRADRIAAARAKREAVRANSSRSASQTVLVSTSNDI